jgi:hypothetical protein
LKDRASVIAMKRTESGEAADDAENRLFSSEYGFQESAQCPAISFLQRLPRGFGFGAQEANNIRIPQ